MYILFKFGLVTSVIRSSLEYIPSSLDIRESVTNRAYGLLMNIVPLVLIKEIRVASNLVP
jgi:hypothetical protein